MNTDTFEIGGKLRKRIYLRGYDTWIEGLGTENRLPLHSFEPSCGMDCGDKLYYQRIGDKISYLDNYFIHDLLEPCTSSVLDTQIEALRIARTPDALIVTLPGTGYRVYRHPIERPGRTHRTESDDKIKDKTNGKEPKYEKTIAIDCRVDSMER